MFIDWIFWLCLVILGGALAYCAIVIPWMMWYSIVEDYFYDGGFVKFLAVSSLIIPLASNIFFLILAIVNPLTHEIIGGPNNLFKSAIVRQHSETLPDTSCQPK